MATYSPKPFTVHFSDDKVKEMYDSLASSHLLEHEVPSMTWDDGITLDRLKELKRKFETGFNWRKVEAEMNAVPHYTVEIEGMTLHYVHQPSPDEGAIPLILMHGWPGTFWDFAKVIEELHKPSGPCMPSFNVVIPSMPGYGFSSLPRKAWTLEDTGRVYNKLMTEVLGYKTYFAQGGDWGSMILRIMASVYPSCRLAHFNMFRCPPGGLLAYAEYIDYLAPVPLIGGYVKSMKAVARSWILSPTDVKMVRRHEDFSESGRGYALIQGTRPSTIGYAIHTPLALLAYIGEKFQAWSDPTLLSDKDILATVALYYLTNTFHSSVIVYKMSGKARNDMATSSTLWRIKCRFGFSYFPYEIGAMNYGSISRCGPLVFYKAHAKGGHFPALDVPRDFISDLREMASRYWWTKDTYMVKSINKKFDKPEGHP
ncbi:alpha/beta-hydrolase [Dacryopinax primogenitus]|uniref:Alpha/beta-hydrolase n=1 Tax=Dacryopinax primogenitus (strain DJM 731) TaxID=1858805 RepID=M5GBW1_DACPD|nr:alpha/beta-hydrolase [Dacryopinax primogenitus]EJU05940.1 alpha/beta-hydrolase [Dacryopinax primogenitus]